MPAPYTLMWLILLLPLASFALIFGIWYENKRVSAWLGILAAAAADAVSIWVLFAELAKPQHWQYGLGKSVAFTSDARTLSVKEKTYWDHDWASSNMYTKFWEQTVDWSLRATHPARATPRDG